MWIFGYGSLIWKTNFPYNQKLLGYVEGYDRNFYHKSTHHRGQPEQPGRVVTLMPSSENPKARVWGIAYFITDSEYITSLNLREKSYDQTEIMFHPIYKCICEETNLINGVSTKALNDLEEIIDNTPFLLNTYISTAKCPNYIGPGSSIKEIAEIISKAEGPSGKNTEYVFNLVNFMKIYLPDVKDEHLYSLNDELISILKKSKSQ